MTGCYVSCVSGLIEMSGWQLLSEACGTDSEQFGHVTNRYGDFLQPYFESLAECKAPANMVHDDICWTSGPFLSRSWYENYVFPNMNYIAEKYGKTHVFIGNADTRILLSGTKEVIYAEVKRCMDIGKQCPGYLMAVGNHIPANTPVESALYYNECYEKLSKR